MKQVSLQLKMHINKVNIINHNIERLMLNIIIWSFGACALLYILFLGNIIFNIVERRTLEADARSLSNEVGDLELTYLSMSSKIDLALSSSMGFKETKINFTTRKSLGLRNLDSIKLSKNAI